MRPFPLKLNLAAALTVPVCLALPAVLPGLAQIARAENRVTIAPGEDVTVVIERPAPKPELAPTQPPFEGVRATVDVALLLDTSNSMDGLIHQAKSQLWTIVQQFARAKKHGQTPTLRVALFEYGNTSLPAAEGYLRQVVPLTDDLDTLSEALFALTTNGGDEYCGQVIDEALNRLDWSNEPGGYKAVFIAGNEPFTQGPVDYQQACKRAIEAGVVINTIHCGAYGSGIDGFWQHGAQLAEGKYLNIDQDRAIVHISAPQDEVILRLNRDLNGTYLWFGDAETRGRLRENQAVQDQNAFGVSESVAVQRAATKASGAYRNAGRDLVDSYEADDTILATLDDEALPEGFRGLSMEQREVRLQTMSKERADLQAEIQKLNAEREAYVAAERRKRAEAAGSTLGDAVVDAVREQLADAGFAVDAPESAE